MKLNYYYVTKGRKIQWAIYMTIKSRLVMGRK